MLCSVTLEEPVHNVFRTDEYTLGENSKFKEREDWDLGCERN
jgi:hypothetical protein